MARCKRDPTFPGADMLRTSRSILRATMESVLVSLPRRTKLGARLILAYHNVVPDDAGHFGDHSLHLREEKFAAQLKAVREEAEVVSLMELLTISAPSSRRVAITFDDAYASSLRLGVARCVSVGCPCTVFVSPGLLGLWTPWDLAAERGQWSTHDRSRFLWQLSGRDPGMLSEQSRGNEFLSEDFRIANHLELEQLRGLSGVTIGNHTMNHPNLGALSNDEVREEVTAANEWLKAFSPAATVPVIAYPYGLPPVDVEAAVPREAASHGLLVTGKWSTPPDSPPSLLHPRWNIPAGMSQRGFALRLRGWMNTR